MSGIDAMERPDTYEERRKHLAGLTDEQLRDYFWELLGKIVEPIVEEARTHTSPSIERSVLLRMGFSSIEAKALVTMMAERGLLGHGAGNLVLRVAAKRGLDIRSAGLDLIHGSHWDDLS
jgi:D-ornithine 4,5-aminomutase subunit alpha